MIGFTYALTNKRGNTIILNDHISDPKRFIALQSYPEFDTDIKNNEIDKEGQNGIWDFYSNYGRKAISFSGIIVGETEADVEAIKNQLMQVLAFPAQSSPSDDGYIYLRWTDLDGKSWEIECKLSNSVKFDRALRYTFALNFTFTLKASNPFIFSQTFTSQLGTRGYITTGGSFPLLLPTILGSTRVNKMTISNGGLAQARTIIRLYGEPEGAVTNPTITNLTTGKFMTIAVTLADASKWIELDSLEGTVIDQDGVDRSGSIVGDSSFIDLEVGNNELAYTSDQDPLLTLYYPSAAFSVFFREAKI